MNINVFGCRNVGKHRHIKGSDKYVTLDILLKFYILDKMIIKYSESKVKLGRPVKGLITSLGIKSETRPKKYKKARYSIGNVSKKDLSKIIREFEKLPYESCEKKSPKNKPNDSYFYLAIQLAKCTMRADALNSDNYPVRTEPAGTKQIPTSHACSTDDI